MPQLRLALAQMNATVGDLVGNSRLIVEAALAAQAAGAHLLATPEMSLTGYPVEDLALRRSFVAASQHRLRELAHELEQAGLGELPVVVGYLGTAAVGMADDDPARPLPQNRAGVLFRGEVVARYAKHHLPNYGVFDEFRIFAPGDHLTLVRVHGVDVALAICEDLWQDGGPVAEASAAGAELLLVINGSPYERD